MLSNEVIFVYGSKMAVTNARFINYLCFYTIIPLNIHGYAVKSAYNAVAIFCFGTKRSQVQILSPRPVFKRPVDRESGLRVSFLFKLLQFSGNLSVLFVIVLVRDK